MSNRRPAPCIKEDIRHALHLRAVGVPISLPDDDVIHELSGHLTAVLRMGWPWTMDQWMNRGISKDGLLLDVLPKLGYQFGLEVARRGVHPQLVQALRELPMPARHEAVRHFFQGVATWRQPSALDAPTARTEGSARILAINPHLAHFDSEE